MTPTANPEPIMTPTAETTVTISTAKGALTGTVREVCAWQAEMQGAFAEIDFGGVPVPVDGVCFDADDIEDAVEEVVCLMVAARAEAAADELREALSGAVDSGVYFEVKAVDGCVIVVLGDREERGYDAWQDVNFTVGQTAKSMGLEFWDSGPLTPCDDDGTLLGGEYHQYHIL